MSRKNRVRKGQPLGLRSASGRKRDRTPLRVEPCDGVIRRRELYQAAANDTDTCDALGRAYLAGLLGSGERAKELMIAGRKIHHQYWIAWKIPTKDSLARFMPQDAGKPLSDEQRIETDRIREQALNDAQALVRARGHNVKVAFDQLVIDINPDCGPKWLDQIVWAQRHGKRAGERDYHMLALAIEGLEAIA